MAHTNDHGHHGGPVQEVYTGYGYEPRDVVFTTLRGWLLGLAIFVLVATGAALIIYKIVVPTYADMVAPNPVGYKQDFPPNPQIQARPMRDIMEYKATEQKLETSAGQGENGTMRIPVDQAMAIMAAQGISGVKDSDATVNRTKAPGMAVNNNPGGIPPGPQR